jgi:hypothetical protein
MDNIVLDINPQPSKRGKLVQRILFFVMGFGNLYQGLLQEAWFRYINFVFGVICIAYALYLHRLYGSKEYLFTDEGIEGPMDSQQKRKFTWEEIVSVELKMYSMKILLKDGRSNKLNLSNLTFEQHNHIKPKIEELIISKGIAVTAG